MLTGWNNHLENTESEQCFILPAAEMQTDVLESFEYIGIS